MLVFAALPGCVRPKLNVVDERTALENQIVGSYEELDRRLQLLASVREADEKDKSSSRPRFAKIRLAAIKARQKQIFNLDDIDELKKWGCLGEANDGSLKIRRCEADADPRVADRLSQLTEEENTARKTILLFVATTSPDLTKKDMPQLAEAYARVLRDSAKSGEWIQDNNGNWKQK